ncbi:VWA domain-containing protein [Crocinitomix catalasitica]|uniref:VWA domain-containing protein n=1 Tax=Crocinitomix catalasitica TaxID=184607 RepID=UPI000487743F|nr:VWA domain-containing protein [Crocinitomix catalasitica]
MRIILCLLILLFNFTAVAQITADRKSYDFGDLYANAETYIDFTFTNNSGKKQYLLNVQKPREVYYKFSGKVLMPDSSIIIRLKINDKIKGKFNYKVNAYFSDSNDPTVLKLTGNIKEVSSNPFTDCPDFNSTPTGPVSYEFAVTVKVLDSLTREPIKNARVYFVQNGSSYDSFKTNGDGIVHEKIPMGYYYMVAERNPYRNNAKEGYLNFQRNYVEILLSKDEVEEFEEELIVYEEPIEEEEVFEEEIIEEVEEEEEESIIIDTEVREEPEVIEEVVEEVIEEEEAPVIPVVLTPLDELPDSVFDERHFKYNNITFILDVSSSMNSAGKLDLLKQSMIELVDILRPNDFISVITYSSTVSVIVAEKTGEDKEFIIDKVNKLRTNSSTAGGDAIRVGYNLNKRVYSPERNNIVIMVTDGAFNRGSNDYMDIIGQNYKDKGIIFSVVGISTSEYLTDHMRSITVEGGGDFVEIRSFTDAETKLVKEIKRTSFRGR